MTASPAAQQQPAAPTDLVDRLATVGKEAHNAYPDNPARLEQLDSHLATVAMVLQHLADEADRQ